MKRTVLLGLLALAILLLAVGAWTVEGLRWLLNGGGGEQRLRPAAA